MAGEGRDKPLGGGGSRPSTVTPVLTGGQHPWSAGPMPDRDCQMPFCGAPATIMCRRLRVCGHEVKPPILFCDEHAAKLANTTAERPSPCRTCTRPSKIHIGRPVSLQTIRNMRNGRGT